MTIEYRVSRVVNPAVDDLQLTITPSVDETRLVVTPTALVSNFAAPAQGHFQRDLATAHEWVAHVRVLSYLAFTPQLLYTIGGRQSCACSRTPIGMPCTVGCASGTGFFEMPTDGLPFLASDHMSLFERIPLTFPALPTPTYSVLGASGCPAAPAQPTYLSTYPWTSVTGRMQTCGVVEVDLGANGAVVPLGLIGGRVALSQSAETFQGFNSATSCPTVPFGAVRGEEQGGWG